MLSLETAQERVLSSIPTLAPERVSLLEAVGRFAAEPLAARVDLPGFDNSAMDGYAVRAEDLKNACQPRPVVLKQVGRVAAGENFSRALSAGECVRIFTGSPLPSGADAVVMQEDASAEGEAIRFVEAARPLENIRLRGEDIRAGTAVIQPGDRMNASTAALLAATGHAETLVRQAPRIALLSTGSELVEPGAPLMEGKIYESNRTFLAALLHELPCRVTSLPLAPDDLRGTTTAIEAAFSEHDFVLTTGGVSVGEFDFVKEAFAQLGGKIDFWKIALRPGKPFVFGTLDGKHLFGLPGNPVSALVTFLLLVRPAVLKAAGARNVHLPRLRGELEGRISNRADRRHFMRARWSAGKIALAGPQSSHRIGALSEANCLIDVPAETEFEAGTVVEALLWQLPEH